MEVLDLDNKGTSGEGVKDYRYLQTLKDGDVPVMIPSGNITDWNGLLYSMQMRAIHMFSRLSNPEAMRARSLFR